MKRRTIGGRAIITTTITAAVIRSSPVTAAAAMLVASSMANQTRSPAIAASHPGRLRTGSPTASIPAV